MAAEQFLVLSAYANERVALEAVEGLIDAALAQVEEHARERAAIEYCTKRSSQEILAVLDLYSLECDHGEKGILENATWLPDEEPVAVVTDVWSRAAIPGRAAKPVDEVSTEPTASLSGTTGPNRPRRRTGQGLLTRHKSDKSSIVSDVSQIGKLQDLGGIPSPVQPARRNHARDEPPDQWTRAALLRAKQAAVEAAEHERVLEIHKEVRGREYYYNLDGKHVVVETVEGDRMPAFRTSPAIGVAAADELQPVPPSGKRAGAGAGAGGARTTPRAGRARPAAAGLGILLGEASAGEQYRPLESEQPALMGSLKLQGGVTLREGGGTKTQGRVFEPEHMTRREFALVGGAQRDEADGASWGSPGTPGVGQAGVQRSPPSASPPIPPPKVSPPKPVTPPTAHERHASLGGAQPLAGGGAGKDGAWRVAQPPPLPRGPPLSTLSLGHRVAIPTADDDELPAVVRSPTGGSVFGSLGMQASSPSARSQPRGTFDRRMQDGAITTVNPKLVSALLAPAPPVR